MNLTGSSNLGNYTSLPELNRNTVHRLRKLPLQQSGDVKLVDRGRKLRIHKQHAEKKLYSFNIYKIKCRKSITLPLYFPYKCVPSILITGRQCWNPSIDGLNDQNTRWNISVFGILVSHVFQTTTHPGFAYSMPKNKRGNSVYDSEKLPNNCLIAL